MVGMALERLGEWADGLREMYQHNGLVRTATNAGMMYGAAKAGAGILGAMGFPGLEEAVDMVTPVAVGITAAYTSDRIGASGDPAVDQARRNSGIQDLLKTGIGALAGLALADNVVNYNGSTLVLKALHDAYAGIHSWASSAWPALPGATMMGVIAGGLGTAGKRVYDGYQRRQRELVRPMPCAVQR